MKKIIKKYGQSFIIVISPDDMKIYNLKVGDIISFEIEKIANINSNTRNNGKKKN